MAGAIQLSEVDFDQIKTNLIDYLKSTGQFTDYDFDGSNLQVILNLISYQAQLNAYSTNMIANESFLVSASLRNNVVANARMIGFLPTSSRSAVARITLSFQLNTDNYPSGLPRYLQIDEGMSFITSANGYSITFNSIDTQTAAISGTGLATFSQIAVTEGAFLTAAFTKDVNNYNQRFTLDNINIDTTTIRVEVQEDPNEELLQEYRQADNLVSLKDDSRIFWIEEVDEGQYELTFGDGYFGRALSDGAKINVKYVVSSGVVGNGVQNISKINFIGRVFDSYGAAVTIKPSITSMQVSDGGAEQESISSIKFRAPRTQAAQSRCVVAEDYENIIREIYPGVDDIHVYGGEELDIPQYGRVFIAIKPASGDSLSAFTKNYITKSLQDYRIASIDVTIVDPEVVYVEAVTSVYYDNKRTSKDSSAIVAGVKATMNDYASSSTLSRFGGAVRYSRIVGAVDGSDSSITRNNTTLRMRRDLAASIGTGAAYEMCFDNGFKTDTGAPVCYSTGFRITVEGSTDDTTYYFEDDTNGNLQRFYLDATGQKIVVDEKFGTIDYEKGEIKVGYQSPVTIVNTSVDNNTVEVRAFPASQDVIAKRSVSVVLDVSKSDIVAVVDTNAAS